MKVRTLFFFMAVIVKKHKMGNAPLYTSHTNQECRDSTDANWKSFKTVVLIGSTPEIHCNETCYREGCQAFKVSDVRTVENVEYATCMLFFGTPENPTCIRKSQAGVTTHIPDNPHFTHKDIKFRGTPMMTHKIVTPWEQNSGDKGTWGWQKGYVTGIDTTEHPYYTRIYSGCKNSQAAKYTRTQCNKSDAFYIDQCADACRSLGEMHLTNGEKVPILGFNVKLTGGSKGRCYCSRDSVAGGTTGESGYYAYDLSPHVACRNSDSCRAISFDEENESYTLWEETGSDETQIRAWVKNDKDCYFPSTETKVAENKTGRGRVCDETYDNISKDWIQQFQKGSGFGYKIRDEIGFNACNQNAMTCPNDSYEKNGEQYGNQYSCCKPKRADKDCELVEMKMCNYATGTLTTTYKVKSSELGTGECKIPDGRKWKEGIFITKMGGCPRDCQYDKKSNGETWYSACDKDRGEKYPRITLSPTTVNDEKGKKEKGATCPEAIKCDVNCEHGWNDWTCDKTKGVKTRSPNITVTAKNGGTACPAPETEPCAQNCIYEWSDQDWECDRTKGKATRSPRVTTPAARGGDACPAPQTKECAKDCVGKFVWSTCDAKAKTQKGVYDIKIVANDLGEPCDYENGFETTRAFNGSWSHAEGDELWGSCQCPINPKDGSRKQGDTTRTLLNEDDTHATQCTNHTEKKACTCYCSEKVLPSCVNGLKSDGETTESDCCSKGSYLKIGENVVGGSMSDCCAEKECETHNDCDEFLGADGNPNRKCTMSTYCSDGVSTDEKTCEQEGHKWNSKASLPAFTCLKFRTNSGAVCQKWTDAKNAPAWIKQFSRWDDNFCRQSNVSGITNGSWCYTSEGDSLKQELCD